MGKNIQKIDENEAMRVQTASGLDIRLFNQLLELELDGMPFGIQVDLLDLRGVDGGVDPPGAYCRISFYKPDITTGASGQENEVKSLLPGAIYLTAEEVLIKGCHPVPSRTNESAINYKDR